MKSSLNPISATLGPIDGALDRQFHALDSRRSSVLLPPVAGNAAADAKRRARSAFIEAIAELIAMPGPDPRPPES
jgi:hypothetical protein